MAYLGLYAQQHRGQESAGIVTWDGEKIREQKGMGLVADVFNERHLGKELKGQIAMGQRPGARRRAAPRASHSATPATRLSSGPRLRSTTTLGPTLYSAPTSFMPSDVGNNKSKKNRTTGMANSFQITYLS